MRSVIRISDGLGNQLFQYAFGYSFSKKTGQEIILDPFFWGTALRSYQLDQFQIKYSEKFVAPAWDYLLGFGPRNARRFKEKYRDKKIKENYHLETEKQAMRFDASIYQINRPTYFQGFWQTPLYFDEFYDEIKQQFTMKTPLSHRANEYARQMASSNSVSLHIRRTDYDREINNVCLNNSFYREAIDRMQQIIGDFTLFVFTDDKEFAVENFDLHDYVLVKGVSDLEELELMRRCKNHIVANSTFSWWGAYLAEHKGGVVFAPVTDIWTDGFYPKEWDLISASVGKVF